MQPKRTRGWELDMEEARDPEEEWAGAQVWLEAGPADGLKAVAPEEALEEALEEASEKILISAERKSIHIN
jgi:hypothetical protein